MCMFLLRKRLNELSMIIVFCNFMICLTLFDLVLAGYVWRYIKMGIYLLTHSGETVRTVSKDLS